MAGKKNMTRIAMWSGPRNISTAMMRAFENRPDTRVVDEPFYAHYLQATGISHPMREEVIASQSTKAEDVIGELFLPLPGRTQIHYQKHMTQHMLPDIDLAWLAGVTNCFLIRSPEEIVASYAVKRDTITEEDIGLKRQFEIFELVKKQTGKVPPVIDSNETLKDPGSKLAKLCQAVGIDFDEAMLAWPAGRRESDGAWAPHWYHAVEASTGFAPFRKREINLSQEQQAVADAGMAYYEALRDVAL